MPLIHATALCLHLLAAAYWVGGMAAFHLAVRPAAVQVLPPPARLALMSAALTRFFKGVTLAIALLLASGLAMVAGAGGFGSVHWSVHAMFAISLVMMVIFAQLRLGPYPRLMQAVAAQDWPAAAAQLDRIRRRVMLNLALGCGVFAIATLGRLA